jgi:hypothetical protein
MPQRPTLNHYNARLVEWQPLPFIASYGVAFTIDIDHVLIRAVKAKKCHKAPV